MSASREICHVCRLCNLLLELYACLHFFLSLERSYYDPDMPSQLFEGPLGKTVFFQRGSIPQEICFFVVYAILLILLTIGYKGRWVMPLVWLFTNGLISKGDAGSWGSDQLAQELVVWMVLLPLSEEWSVDAWIRRKHNIPSKYTNHQVKSVACLGLVLLINMMYLGCTLERTYHAYGWDELHESDWFWPDFPLVHYAANGSGTYNNWFTKIVRETAVLNQFMTFSGFLIETLMPPLCLLFNQRYSHLFAINLMALHFGIGLVIAIPHFAAMGVLIHTIWVPTHVWNKLLGESSECNEGCAVAEKTDNTNTNGESTSTEVATTQAPKTSLMKRTISFGMSFTWFLIQCFFLFLLFCTFMNSNNFLLEYVQAPADFAYKYFLMTNSWGMWSPGAVRISPYTVILGGREREDGKYDAYDLWEFLKSGKEVRFKGFTEDYLADSTYLYPSTRWEKALGDDWEEYLMSSEYNISGNLMKAWCIFINEDLEKMGRPPMDAIEIRVHLRPIGTPESGKRYPPVEFAQEGVETYFCFEDNDDDEEEEQVEYDEDEDEVETNQEEEGEETGSDEL